MNFCSGKRSRSSWWCYLSLLFGATRRWNVGNWFIDARNAEESRIATLQREYDRMYQLVKAAIALHREWDAAADLNIEAFSDDATEIVDRFDAACKAYEET